MSGARRALAYAALGVGIASTAQAQSPTAVQAGGVKVRCHVAAGPRLERCQLTDRGNLTDTDVPRVIAHLEERKPCLLTQVRPGETVEWREGFRSPLPEAKISVITQVDWAERPTAQQLLRHYPLDPKARASGGQARVACVVTRAGQATGCEVQAESPQGLGFGQAAVAAMGEMKFRPMLKDCEPVDGGRILMPFVLPPMR